MPASTIVEEPGTASPMPIPDESVKPYKIHVSTKYLDLTRQKLELTRLPHEVSQPKSKEWWEPKPQVEPLIDFWLEQYSWRDHEAVFNNTVPQFRTTLQPPPCPHPVRMHFIHVRSRHQSAIPLLLIPPFPLANLSLAHLMAHLAEPADPDAQQPFHVVIPSLPGVGFSDALPNNTALIDASAALFDALMARLGYPAYLASNAGPGSQSPAQVDWRLARALAENHPHSCVGTHLISPPLAPPRLGDGAVEWGKWKLAKTLKTPLGSYTGEDFAAIVAAEARSRSSGPNGKGKGKGKGKGIMGRAGSGIAVSPGLSSDEEGHAMREPNTLAYALCDSPTGLLVFILRWLRTLAPNRQLSPTEIINLTEMAWLPGPEGAMRFWAHCAGEAVREIEELGGRPRSISANRKRGDHKPRVAITVFRGDETDGGKSGGGPNGGANGGRRSAESDDVLPRRTPQGYACPGWANAGGFDVVHAARVYGRPGLLAWERPTVISDGIRALARAVAAVDARLRPSKSSKTPKDDDATQVTDDAGATVASNSTTINKDASEEVGNVSPMEGAQEESSSSSAAAR